jgi:hypothetical protein
MPLDCSGDVLSSQPYLACNSLCSSPDDPLPLFDHYGPPLGPAPTKRLLIPRGVMSALHLGGTGKRLDCYTDLE